MKLMLSSPIFTLFLSLAITDAFITPNVKPSVVPSSVGLSLSSTCLFAKRDISRLAEFANQHDVQFSPSAELTLNSGEDYGIKLVKSAQQNECILSVPKSLVLDSDKIKREWFEYLEKPIEYIEGMGLHDSALNFVLITKVLYENSLGEESKWYEWIQSLPSSFSTGVCMDEVELECLPPFALALANFEKQQLDIFMKAYELMKDTSIYTETDYDLFLWAFNVVITRCWRYVQENEYDELIRPISVPYGDMFNHKEPPNVMVRDSDDQDRVEFVLTQDIDVSDESEGADLFLSYGLTNPHRFLTVFGFCDESMPEVFSQLLFDKQTPELVELGCNDRSKMVYRCDDGGISTAVWDCILYTLLAQVPQEQQLFYSAHLEGNLEEKRRFHKKYALEEALTLRNHVEATANEFRDLVVKIDAMDDDEKAKHPRIDLIRRHNSFLCGVFDRVKSRIDERAQKEVLKRRGITS
ncbi:SET domain-containing protein [Chaetoceros tenuissimus]|uniref:SET domain-containing protein n=1 Tax=Chaetoceros tenuissimus TaxID=426638 RepID=A0AAD3D1L3_9STRA|nr:SET domain-containing protein [Chaetoceros tenuissimus]